MEEFVQRYEAAWASREKGAMKPLWHEDGTLYHPILSEPIPGRLVPANNDRTKATTPGFKWTLIQWGGHGDVVFLEWQNDAIINDKPMSWNGVDRMILKGGKIWEETVYFDTHKIWAALDPAMDKGALVDAKTLESYEE